MDAQEGETRAGGQPLDGGKPEPGSRFEAGSVLAWLVDQEGYRAGADWTFTPIDGLAGARRGARRLVDVRDALGRDSTLPEIRIEPTSEGRVRVTARVELVVQLYGEESALAAGQAVVVPYGSVVRAGPLLFAPLYAEQVESVRLGRMPLPRPGGGVSLEERGSLSALDAGAAPPNPRRPLLLAWAICWFLAFPASAAFVVLLSSYPVDGRPPWVNGRELVYTVAALWFLIGLAGLGIHRLVSRFVQAGQPEPGA